MSITLMEIPWGGPMRSGRRSSRFLLTSGASTLALAALVAGGLAAIRPANAAFPWFKKGHHHPHGVAACPTCVPGVGEGYWYWMRSPEQERQVVMGLYTRYCIRCHGVDGRGVWDIPGVPDFTNPLWQACHPDPALTRSILEGRGAIMPPFRGTLTLEEAWAMGRYLRTFVPGTEVSRPDLGRSGAATGTSPGASPSAGAVPPTPAPPAPNSRGAFAR
ncbi:MAG TPA: cytochrome c [Isosphaeraceae bacterium]|nr:cytochrome c [Isosphaeraceae bacterium]